MSDVFDYSPQASAPPPPAPKGGSVFDYDPNVHGNEGGNPHTNPDSVKTAFDLLKPNKAVGEFLDGVIGGAEKLPQEAFEVADMIASIPAGLLATGADIGVRARSVAAGQSRELQSINARDARNYVNRELGSPLHKMAALAGLGQDEGQTTVVGGLMSRLSDLLSKGGEKVEELTGGRIKSGEVDSIVQEAMALGGGKGLEVGLKRLLPESMKLEGVKLAPEAMQKMREERMQGMEPREAAEVPKAAAAEAGVAAAVGKTKMQPAKDLVFDPIEGTLKEKAPEVGEGLPKPSTLDVALEKVSSGKSFDLTAEERIAYKGWQKEPLPEPLVDESGKALRVVPKGQRGSAPWINDIAGRWTKQDDVQKDYGGVDFNNPVTLKNGTRLSGFTDRSQAAFHGYDKNGERITTRVDDVPPEDLVYSRDSNRTMGRIQQGLTDRITRVPKGESGSVDPRLLARLSAIGLGAWAGQHFSDDHSLTSAILFGLGAGMLSKARPIQFAKGMVAALRAEGPRVSIADPAQIRENLMRLGTIDTINMQNHLEDLVPKEADRNALTHAMEAGPEAISKLPEASRKAAGIIRGQMDALAAAGLDADVLKATVDNYMTHIWDWSANKGKAAAFFESRGSGMSPSSPYAKARSIGTLQEGIDAGLKPVTEDASRILGIYSNSMITAIANKQFLQAIREVKVPLADGKTMPAIMKEGEAPRSYVSVNHPLLQGVRVHPDLEGQLKLMFDTNSPGNWMKAAQGVSDIVKRFAVSASLFHAKSLTEAAIRASSNPFKPLAALPGILKGTNQYLQELKKGSASEIVERSVRAGLMYSVKGAGSEDAGVGFYSAMKGAQDFANQVIPGAGLPLKGFAELSKQIDKFMWERMHPAFKLMIFDEKSRQLQAASIKAAKGGRSQALTQGQADAIAASFANDLEGGLNYRKIAMEAQTRVGRQLAETAFTPGGRRGLQIGFFAPDWNIAAVRMVANAFGPSSGVKGVISPATLADLHRNLIAKSALYYFIGFDAVNMSMSGHHIWQNKDWTKIDMDPAGERHLQIDKGMMEVPNMVRQPAQEVVGKLGFIPREAANQAFGTEYLNPRVDKRTGTVQAGPAMKESRPMHVVKQMLPFAAQDRPTKGLGEELLSGSGLVQITGSTPESRLKAKEEARKRREKEKASQ